MNYVICVVFLIAAGALADGKPDRSSFSPNIIYPTTEDIEINKGDLITIHCQGDSKLRWKYPDEPKKEVIITNDFINGKFFSKLRKNHADVSDIGYYECFNEKNSSVSVYVFVNGTGHLFLPSINLVVTAFQYKTAIIPCRTTQKNLDVHLKFNEEVIDLHANQWKFDNKVGFFHENANHKLTGGYDCCASAADIEEDCEYINLEILKHTDSAPKPVLSQSNIFVSVGGDLTLVCSVLAEEIIKFQTNWAFPNKSNSVWEKYVRTNRTNSYLRNFVRYHEEVLTLKIYNVSRQDEGLLVCYVKDHMHNVNNESATLKVLKDGETVLKIKNDSIKNIEIDVHKNPKWIIEYSAYPIPSVQWFGPHNKEISNSTEFIIVQTPEMIKLEILDVKLNDSGIYRLELDNGVKEKLQLNLTVKSPPIVTLPEGRIYYQVFKNYTVDCKISSFPLPTSIQWYYKQCDQLLNSCNGTLKPVDEKHYKNTNIEYNSAISSLNITAIKNTYLTCNASNQHGNGEKEFLFMVSDVPGGFAVVQDPPDVIVGDQMKLTCMVTKQDFSVTIKWYKISKKDGSAHPVAMEDKYIVENSTQFSYNVSVIFPKVSVNDSGEYVCQFNPLNSTVNAFSNLTQHVTVMEPRKPIIHNDTTLNGKVYHLKPLSPFHLKCVVSGTPQPSIEWYKNGNVLNINNSDPEIEFINNKTMINIKHFQESYQGEYECRAKNKVGTTRMSATLTLQDESGTLGYIVGVVIIAIILVITIVILCIKIQKERKQQQILAIAGLQNFKEGALQNMNCEQTVDEQAELLPYDKKWEFPRDKLKLGKQLGSGAFGVVMKAEAYGILEGEPHTTVAVKMVKRNASYTYMKALASELKIMVHLGKHLNVVNLLGACTNNITKMELLVIVEYCRYGNLHNYLLRHRQEFIDQVDPNTGLVDPNIGAEAIARANSFSKKNKIKYADLSFARNHSGEIAVDYRIGLTPSTSSTGSDTDQVSMEPGGEDGCILSNNSVQPEWRSNYRGDYRDGVRLICTRDLICWAFQVARGMEYLAARKVLHGDLAARNILLAEENIVKICDFGLAKSMYKSDNYKKKGDGPLPVKWMAIESIRDRVFSTQSDVWSYGIVLWEFFSLARTPYPGMEADEKLYNNIVNGYRMEKPDYATQHVYQTMLDCWNYNPNKRPTFSKLSEVLGNMLEESVRRHYIDLNDPYLDMNAEWLKSNENDYLSMMSAPTYGNLVSPSIEDQDNGYINSPAPGTSGDDSGYLCMKSPSSGEGFHRLHSANGTVFDFGSPAQRRLLAQEAGEGLELRPMLRNNSDSDVDQQSVPNDLNKNFNNSANIVPIIKNINGAPCISNPGYQCVTHIPPVTDNYINMPQSKQMLKDKDQCQIDDGTVMSISNPSYMDVNTFRPPQISPTSYLTTDKYVNLPKP